MSKKKEPQMIQIHPFEEKKIEKGERISQFDGL